MDKNFAFTAISAAVAIAFAPMAYAQTTVPSLAVAKAPGTVAAPAPATLSYMPAAATATTTTVKTIDTKTTTQCQPAPPATACTVPAPVKRTVYKSRPRPQRVLVVKTPAPVAAERIIYGTSATTEAQSWQAGGTARPVMGADGLLMFPYGQYQPTLICMPLRGCDVELQAGEIINNVSFGDTVRWIASPATTGAGATAIQHVIVKPTEENLETNLNIYTTRRTYHLTVKSTPGTYTSRIGYYYPAEMVQTWNGQAEAERRKADKDAERKISDLPIASIEQLNLDGYKVKGDKSLPWYPTRVFDEGTHVWIQMPPTIKASEAPALVLIGKDGKPELVNYRVKEADQGGAKVTYYIVDKLFTKAALIVGVGGDQRKIEIDKISKTSSWFSRN